MFWIQGRTKKKWNPEVIFFTSSRRPFDMYDGHTEGKFKQLDRRIHESGGRIWNFDNLNEIQGWRELISRLQPRVGGVGLADPRKRPIYLPKVINIGVDQPGEECRGPTGSETVTGGQTCHRLPSSTLSSDSYMESGEAMIEDYEDYFRDDSVIPESVSFSNLILNPTNAKIFL